jgi:hypothetical protein
MSVANSFSRLADYYRRHGLANTWRRARLALDRSLFASRMVVFYCDLQKQPLRPVKLPKTFQVVRRTALAELDAERLKEITSFWNTELANRNLRERFQKGASLWMVECGGKLAGYGWTLKGQTIAPYYFPMAPDDVQLFDFYVVPNFRGRALHWLLTGHILNALVGEGGSRAFADTHEWNLAQLASFKMTPFRPLGYVKTYDLFGHLFTRWIAQETVKEERKGLVPKNEDMRVLRSNE